MEGAEPLPKLPLPNIKATMDRYLDAISAVVSHEELERTKAKVETFLADEPLLAQINNLLAKGSEEMDNWSYEFWLKDMYMHNPVPLPVNSNPGWVFPKQNFTSDHHRISYVAKVVHGLLMYKQKIEKELLPPDQASSRDGTKSNLCMDQYYRLFTTYRYPGVAEDYQVVTNGRESRKNESIIVMKQSLMFEVPVKTDGVWISEENLAKQLLILDQDKSLSWIPFNERVPVLTSAARSKWDPENFHSLKSIESSLMIVCLDDPCQNLTDVNVSHKMMLRQMIDGMGPFLNGSNRWFDKTMQFVCAPNGVSGLCYEHSVAEGIAVVAVITEVLKKVSSDDIMIDVPNVADERYQARRLGFRITEEMRAMISEAIDDFKRLSDDVDSEVFKFEEFGKDFMKKSRCSPDAFVQLSLQLAHYRLHGRLCFTYESASTRRFRHGRVDNIRASHPEALEWAREMVKDNLDKTEKLKLFKNAVSKQTKIMTENISGEGLDIPMLGIREACKIINPEGPLPDVFDEIYVRSNQFQLSTSQVPIALEDSYMGYGAVVHDGYGVSYNLQANHIIFCVSSFFGHFESSSLRMVKSIGESLSLLRELLSE